MNLGRCLENLKCDISNSGPEEDTFAIICYITMANQARQMLQNSVRNAQEIEEAKQYLALCRESGSDALRCVAIIK